MAKKILLIDDEEGIRQSLRGILEDEGYEIAEAGTGEDGLAQIERQLPDMVFLDIWLPGIDGMTVLKEAQKRHPELPVVMISGHGTIENAVSALRLGAYDFIEKPLSLEKILLTTTHTLEMGALRRENKALKAVLAENEEEIVGQSPVMRKFLQELSQVAPTDAWVLITGENGTGKELAARAVHRGSRRKNAPFVAVNCAAIPEDLIESELFGHEKGAFTGADTARAGKFEMADGGTLFLDEIADMSLKTQAKILRILQEQSFERVGGTRSIRVDVRVIAATNKDLEQAIANNEFRQDLYYRLRVFPLYLPPLRERQGDVPLLIHALSRKVESKYNAAVPTFSGDALQLLNQWSWPGNVRELAHLLERLTILYSGQQITPEKLPSEMLPPEMLSKKQDKSCPNAVLDSFLALDYKSAKNAFETYYLEEKLKTVDGNISRLADLVGLERSNIHRKLKACRTADGADCAGDAGEF